MFTTETTIKLHPFTLEDAQAVVDLINAHSQYLFGSDGADLDDMVNDWTSPGIDLKECTRVLKDHQGNIIGYIEVWDTSQPHVLKYAWGMMHPDAWNSDYFRKMLTWAENCTRSRITLAPEGTRVVMSFGVPSIDERRKSELEGCEFDLVRHFYRMQIELDHPLEAPLIPDGLTVAPINMETELKSALLAMDDAFKDHWGFVEIPIEESLEAWNHFIENDKDFDSSLWYLAKQGDEIVGACRCSPKMVDDPDMGLVAQLCVRKPWRCQGLGMALLLTAFQEFARRGKKRVGLGVDASSLTNATRLYEKAGMHITRKFDTYHKELRPGVEIKTVK